MRFKLLPLFLVALCAAALTAAKTQAPRPEKAQVPTWSDEDMELFLNGSIGTEVVPEAMLAAFMKAYPDLYPGSTLEAFGLVAQGPGKLPMGVSRAPVKHLGGLPSLGVNCASCHAAEVLEKPGAAPLRVLGMTAPFDVEAFFGSLAVAMARTAAPDNMRNYLAAYLQVSDPQAGKQDRERLEALWASQRPAVETAIAEDPLGAVGAGPGSLHELKPEELALNRKILGGKPDLPSLARGHLKLFHNVRMALHFPEPLPAEAPPLSGPGRNNAFGLLAAGLVGIPPIHAPVKYGLLWNVAQRRWVHWDGNTRSPLIRNLAGALGLGAPLIGKRGVVDMPTVLKQTALTEHIAAPRYPFPVDDVLAGRGQAHYLARCASCHDRAESDSRLIAAGEVDTDRQRLKLFDKKLADAFNKFFAELEIDGYEPPKEPTIRATGKYWAADLRGAWARAPYLHNGSVRTMRELLKPAAARAKTFRLGSRVYDQQDLGFVNDGRADFDAAGLGNSNSGHEYGTDLGDAEKAELIEYLKTL